LNNAAKLDEMAAEVQEMLDSARAVKGDRFVLATAGVFRQLQLAWLIGVLQGLADEELRDTAANVAVVAADLTGSTARAMLRGLSQQDGIEATTLAEQMHKRQIELSRRMKPE
jgi:hypothetical protein